MIDGNDGMASSSSVVIVNVALFVDLILVVAVVWMAEGLAFGWELSRLPISMAGRDLGTLDELDLQIKPMFTVEDAAHPALSTLLQQVCYAEVGSPLS